MSPPSVPYDDDAPLPPPRRSAASTAWVLVFVDGVLLGCGSLYWLLRGRFFDENVYRALTATTASDVPAENVTSVAIRLAGVLGLSASLVFIALALGAYRGGDRWAWYATWAIPLYCSLEIATLASYQALTPTVAVWDLGLFSLALAALVAGYRHFFAVPEERPRRPREEHRSAPA
jgi:hypothetical protein